MLSAAIEACLMTKTLSFRRLRFGDSFNMKLTLMFRKGVPHVDVEASARPENTQYRVALGTPLCTTHAHAPSGVINSFIQLTAGRGNLPPLNAIGYP